MRLLLAFEDVTDRVQRERDREQGTGEIYHRVKNRLQVIMSFVVHDVLGRERRSDLGRPSRAGSRPWRNSTA
jgi:hypothetical protein